MNSARKIASNRYPPFRRHSDRVEAINLATQQVEREHAMRMRRMFVILASAAAILLLNGVAVTLLG